MTTAASCLTPRPPATRCASCRQGRARAAALQLAGCQGLGVALGTGCRYPSRLSASSAPLSLLTSTPCFCAVHECVPQFPSTLEKGLNKLMSLKDSFGGMVSQAGTATYAPAHPPAHASTAQQPCTVPCACAAQGAAVLCCGHLGRLQGSSAWLPPTRAERPVSAHQLLSSHVASS